MAINRMKIASHTEQQHKSGNDYINIIEKDGIIVFALADGAGNNKNSDFASNFVSQACKELLSNEKFDNPDDFEFFLSDLDEVIFNSKDWGETTAVVGKIINNVIMGASVGDSQAWLLGADFDYQLTEFQYAKPLLGSLDAKAIGFGPMLINDALVIGSDGLFNYAKFSEIKKLSLSEDLNVQEIIDLAKNEANKLSDDASVIIIKKL